MKFRYVGIYLNVTHLPTEVNPVVKMAATATTYNNNDLMAIAQELRDFLFKSHA